MNTLQVSTTTLKKQNGKIRVKAFELPFGKLGLQDMIKMIALKMYHFQDSEKSE